MKKLVLILGLAAVVAACTKPVEKGTIVASTDAIEADAANSGKRFAVEGFLSAPNSINAEDGVATGMYIYSEPEGEGEKLAYIEIVYGKANNAFYIPMDNFDDADISFKDNEGGSHKYDDKCLYSFTAKQEGSSWSYTDVRIDPVQ